MDVMAAAMTYDPFDEDVYSPSMTHWFGTPWPYPELPAGVCSDRRLQIDVPVGEPCLDCGEVITADDSGIRMPVVEVLGSRWGYLHVECQLRNVMCPVCMGLLAGPHGSTGAERRAEGLVLLAWSRKQVR